jgi:hypothetical protein
VNKFNRGDYVQITDTQVFRNSKKKPRVTVWQGRVVGVSAYGDGWYYMVRPIPTQGRKSVVGVQTVPVTDMKIIMPHKQEVVDNRATKDEVAKLLKFMEQRKVK